jgi:hypothetical protein
MERSPKPMRLFNRRNISINFLCLGSLFFIACGPNESILKSGANNDQTSPTPQASRAVYDTVDAEVENMRTADFNFILVLGRKDSGKMQSDDKAFVRTNMSGANRRSLVDDEKAIVIGSNARVPQDLLTKLNDRFDIQDFSKPEAEIPTSAGPANANMMH